MGGTPVSLGEGPPFKKLHAKTQQRIGLGGPPSVAAKGLSNVETVEGFGGR